MMNSDEKENIAVSYSRYKFVRWILKGLSAVVFSSTFLYIVIFMVIITAVVSSKKSFSTTTNYTAFNAQVESYRNVVIRECEKQGISEYSNVILAIMQCSTGGDGSDIMNSSDKESNTQYSKQRGSIQSATYSIYCGVSEVKTLLELCGVRDINDTARLSILYEAYELNRGYVQYAIDNGGYSSYNAQDYMNDNDLMVRNPNFAVSVSMYMSLLTNALKQFIFPLSIYTIQRDYTEENKTILFKGVNRQIVLSSSEGTVTKITYDEDVATIEINTDDYTLIYRYISDINVNEGDTVEQGKTLGMVTWIEEQQAYCIEFEMLKDDDVINPNDYLDKLTIEKAELDEASQEEGRAIAEYAKNCINNLPYVEGGSSASGCDEIGFIYNVFSTFVSYDEEYFNLPTDDFVTLIDCKYTAYKNTVTNEIRPMIMYEGDVIIYANDEGEYIGAGVYIGESDVVHMTPEGVVKDAYNYNTPAVLLRFLGQKNLGMTWPLPGYTREDITSEFNPERVNPVTGIVGAHNGTDIAAPTGTEVVAAADGEVIASNYNSSAGYHIIIDHGNGIKTYYYHSSNLIADEGDSVTAGQTIMLVGSTGQSTGPHLHFGITIDDEWVNAMDYKYYDE